MQIFGEILFLKPKNNTLTTDKRLKTTEKIKIKIFFSFSSNLVLVEFLQLVRCLEHCWHDNHVSTVLTVYLLFKCRFVA